MRALPSGTKQINLLGEKLLQISALSLKGEELQLRLPPRESARPGEYRWKCLSSNASAAAGARDFIGADTLLGACPAGAQCIAADAGSDGKRR